MSATFILCFLLCGYIFSIQSIEIPDNCIRHGSSSRCYYYYHQFLPHYQSREFCTTTGGKLAVITEDDTWHLIIDNILKHRPTELHPSDIWLGAWIGAGAEHLNYGEGLEKTSYWTPDRKGYDYIHDRCLYAKSSNWQWYLQKCGLFDKLPFICEYKGNDIEASATCNVSQISIPNANFQHCNTKETIGNGESIKVQCWKGFNFKGDDHIICKNGIWQRPTPECVPGCKSPGVKPHSKLFPIKSYYEIGEEIVFICDQNYVSWKNYSVPHFILTCQKGGEWSEENSHCTDEKFSTLEIDINNHEKQHVVLHCPLNSDVVWFRNHNQLENTAAFDTSSHNGSLVVDIKGYTTEGIYFCQNSTYHLGNVFYHLTSRDKCTDTDSIPTENIASREGENVILKCPQSVDDRVVKWYKGDIELKHFSENKHVLPDKGLYLRNVQLSDEGIYTCKAILKRGGNLCGKTNFVYKLTVTLSSTKSICGATTPVEKYDTLSKPWLVTLQNDDELTPFCYGTLLSTKWVITTASCLSNLRRKKTLNVNVRFHLQNDHQEHKVESFKIHPGFQNNLNRNNIGLVKLQTEVKFSNNYHPICFENIDLTQKEQCDDSPITASVIGRGSLLTNITDDSTLEIENLTLATSEECRKLSPDIFCFENSELSYFYPGDNGSPLFVNHKNRYYLLGIFAWAERSIGVGLYDYFVNVYHHYFWISEVIGN